MWWTELLTVMLTVILPTILSYTNYVIPYQLCYPCYLLLTIFTINICVSHDSSFSSCAIIFSAVIYV